MAMNRRELLQLGAATIAANTLAKTAFPQNAPKATAQPLKKLKLDAYSRTLHWLRKPEDVAEACHEIGNTTIDLTVRVYPGHVDPDKVKTDLPLFVNTLKQNGVTVSCMACEIVDADTPNAEAMLDTASSLGIHHHWWRGLSYDQTKPYWPQIDAFKPRVEKLAKLEEKYGTKAMYHPTGNFGMVFFDLLYLLRNFDPRYVSAHYDTGNWLQINQQNVVAQLRLGAPYIGGVVLKDAVAEYNSPTDQAGAASAVPNGGRGGGTPSAAASDGRGGARGPLGGGPPNPWRTRQVPVGTGIINLPLIAQTLKEINFDGPMECQPEWPELGGPDQGKDTITVPRQTVIDLLKRDRLRVEAAFAPSGLL